MNTQINTLIHHAIQYLQSGKLPDAEILLKRALQIEPENFDALNLLGTTLAQQGRLEESADILFEAVKLNPTNPSGNYTLANVLMLLNEHEKALEFHENVFKLDPNGYWVNINYGISLSRLNRHEEAIHKYRKAVEIDPSLAEGWSNLSNCLKELKRFDEALAYYDKAIQLNSNYAEAWFNKGVTLNNLKRHDEALAHFDHAIQLNPEYAEAWSGKGVALSNLERHDEALAHYDRAIQLIPEYDEAWLNKGITLSDLKRHDEALAHYDHAIHLNSDYAEAWLNKGATLNVLKRHNEALAHYDRSIQLKPDYAEAWSGKGVTLTDLNRLDQALAHYDRALQLNSDYAEAWSNKGNALVDLKRFDEALVCFDKALDINPDLSFVYGTRLHAKMHICDWKNIESECVTLYEKIQRGELVTPPFPVLGLTDAVELQVAASKRWIGDKYPENFNLGAIPKRSKRHKIRLAYLSADFREHPSGYNFVGLFENLDKSRFETIAISLSAAQPSEFRARLVRAFDQFIDATDKSDREVATLMRDLEIDIAVDIMGPTQNERIGVFALRAAPIQVNQFGWSSATPYMDYLISDRITFPVAYRQLYSEKFACLPHTWFPTDDKRPIAARTPSRTEAGLPESGVVFCLFNASYKITPDVFSIWMRILKETGASAASVLWLRENNPNMTSNLRLEAQRHGINPDRLIFAPPIKLMEDHLARLRLADLFLDTFPFTAQSTSIDALWAGLPVLTRMGQSPLSRLAGSILQAMGLPELVTTSVEEYEKLAIELATQPERLTQIKQKLAQNRSSMPLFNTALYTRHIEEAYTQMYERYHSGLAPDHIDVVL